MHQWYLAYVYVIYIYLYLSDTILGSYTHVRK
jgi:hypothetical protein